MKLTKAEAKRVVSFWEENFSNGGYWAQLIPGLECASAGSHICHEETMKELKRAIRYAIPCNCADCKALT